MTQLKTNLCPPPMNKKFLCPETSQYFRGREKNSQKVATGFTLIEALLYVALVAVVISAIVFFGLWIIQVGAKTKANFEALGNARRAMENIVYEIKKSQSVYTPTSIFDADLGQLSLEQASAAGGDESSVFVDFFICGQSLCLKKEQSDPILLTNSSVIVTKLMFSQRLNATNTPSIKISLSVQTASSTRPERSSSIDLVTAANLRSY